MKSEERQRERGDKGEALSPFSRSVRLCTLRFRQRKRHKSRSNIRFNRHCRKFVVFS